MIKKTMGSLDEGMAIRKTGERVVPKADPNRNPWNGMMYSENY
jgi:hypothetical protein